MWSHYGNKHKGICLTFDVNKHIELFSKFPYSVEYPPFYPRINFIRDLGTFKSRRFGFATKSNEWAYESEVRIIRDDTNPPYRNEVNFNKIALKAIKFGYKTKVEDHLRLKKILNMVGGYEHVKFYLAKLKKFEFRIEFVEIFP